MVRPVVCCCCVVVFRRPQIIIHHIYMMSYNIEFLVLAFYYLIVFFNPFIPAPIGIESCRNNVNLLPTRHFVSQTRSWNTDNIFGIATTISIADKIKVLSPSIRHIPSFTIKKQSCQFHHCQYSSSSFTSAQLSSVNSSWKRGIATNNINTNNINCTSNATVSNNNSINTTGSGSGSINYSSISNNTPTTSSSNADEILYYQN